MTRNRIAAPLLYLRLAWPLPITIERVDGGFAVVVRWRGLARIPAFWRRWRWTGWESGWRTCGDCGARYCRDVGGTSGWSRHDDGEDIGQCGPCFAARGVPQT